MPLGAWRLMTWLVLSAAKALPPVTRRAKVMASVWTVLIMELLIVRMSGFLATSQLAEGGLKSQETRVSVKSSSQNPHVIPKLHNAWNGCLIGAVRSTPCAHHSA
jgi:hypothetical protein